MLLAKNKTYRWNFFVSAILNLMTWIFLYWQIQPQVEPVVLRYNIYFGINLIGPWWQVFWWPLLGLIILIVNFILANWMLRNNRFLSYFLVYTATLCQILLAVVSFFAVLING